MRSKGGRTIKLSPVDEDGHVTDHPARANLEALMDQKLFHQRIKSERSAAYWFAATLWGVSGMALGAILGVFVTLMVQNGSAETWRQNYIAGAASREAIDSVNHRDPVLRDPAENPQQQRP
jgi:hypothetical protein